MELSKALDRGRRVGTYSPNPGNRKWDDLMVVRASRRREAKVKLVGWSKERLVGSSPEVIRMCHRGGGGRCRGAQCYQMV